MSTPLHLVLLGLLILSSAVWIGGMAAVTILSVTSRTTLQPEARTALFRDFGRRYFVVAGGALIVAIGTGLALLIDRGWDGLATAIVVVVGVLLILLAVGVKQARAMRERRQVATVAGGVLRGAGLAAVLRALLGVLSLAVFVLALWTAA